MFWSRGSINVHVPIFCCISININYHQFWLIHYGISYRGFVINLIIAGLMDRTIIFSSDRRNYFDIHVLIFHFWHLFRQRLHVCSQLNRRLLKLETEKNFTYKSQKVLSLLTMVTFNGDCMCMGISNETQMEKYSQIRIFLVDILETLRKPVTRE